MSNSDLIFALRNLIEASEHFYKTSNQLDIRIDDLKFRAALAKAKQALHEVSVTQ